MIPAEHTSALTEDTGGRLVYLAENLASLHAAPDMAWLTARFEFLGEKALGASLADEAGTYHASRSAGARPATARALWEELGIDALAGNTAAPAAFARAHEQGVPLAFDVAEVFPGRTPSIAAERVIVAPVTFNRELIGTAVLLAEPSTLVETMAAILATHTAVAIHQLRQREEAGRLHSVDARLWVPDENFLLAAFRREFSRARRYGRELGVVLLRLENESEFRFRFGDFFTDHLLRRIGSQLLATVRDSDVLGALAGGYAVLHTETSLEGTNMSAERLREVVVEMVTQRFPEVPVPEISVTAAAFPAHGDNLEALMARLTPERSQDIAA